MKNNPRKIECPQFLTSPSDSIFQYDQRGTATVPHVVLSAFVVLMPCTVLVRRKL